MLISAGHMAVAWLIMALETLLSTGSLRESWLTVPYVKGLFSSMWA